MKMLLCGALLALTLSQPVTAKRFEFVFHATLSAGDTLATASGGANLLGAATPFTFTARFDDSSPDLVGPAHFPGFVAYSPTSAAFDIAGKHYTVLTAAASVHDGIAVALFDPTNFFSPGLYAAGLIVNPLADATGIVGDFTTATPAFHAGALTPTTFGGFNGAGFNAGYGCAPGDPGPCVANPLQLTGRDGVAYLFGFTSGDRAGGSGSATLTALPEPATWAMLLAGFGGVGLMARSRRRMDVAA